MIYYNWEVITSFPLPLRMGEIASLTSGGFAVLESSYTLITYTEEGVSSPPTTIPHNRLSVLKPLRDVGGRFVVSWITDGGDAFVQVFDKDGAAVTDPFNIAVGLNECYTFTILPFPNGRFIALFSINEGRGSLMQARSFFFAVSRGVTALSEMYPILSNVLDSNILTLKNGGWLLYATYSSGIDRKVKKLVLKAFSSISDQLGVETHPSSVSINDDYLLPGEMLEVGSNPTSNLVLTYHAKRGGAFGVKCSLKSTDCDNKVAPTTNEQIENVNKEQDQTHPTASMFSGTSDHVVAWQSVNSSSGGVDIIARFGQTKEVRLNAVQGSVNTNPAVAMIDSQNYFAVWQRLNPDGSGWDIYGRRVYKTIPDPEILISQNVASDQLNVSVACSVATVSKCVIVWMSVESSGGYGIYGKQFRILPRNYNSPTYRYSSEFKIAAEMAIRRTLRLLSWQTVVLSL